MIVLLSEFNERASFQFDIITFDASNKFNRERQNTELVVLQTSRAVGIDASQLLSCNLNNPGLISGYQHLKSSELLIGF